MIDEINPLDLKKKLIEHMKRVGMATKPCSDQIGISYLSLKRFLQEEGKPYTNTLFKIAHYLDIQHRARRNLSTWDSLSKEINPCDFRKPLLTHMKKSGITLKACASQIGIEPISLKRFLYGDGNPQGKTVFKIINYLEMQKKDKKN